MKFKLTTLFFVLSLCAVAIAWYSDRCRFADASEQWSIEKQTMNQEFNRSRLKVVNGSYAVAGGQAALEFLEKIDNSSIFMEYPVDECKETANEIAVRELINVWRYRDDINYSMDNMGFAFPKSKRDWAFELAEDLWRHGKLSAPNDFFDVANGTIIGQNLDSKDHESLQELIARLAESTN